MPKTKRNIGKEILDGLGELRRGECGRVTAIPNVAQIREATGLSQARFAQLLGVSTRTLQDWEQGKSEPDQAAQAYLTVIVRDPEAVQRALQSQGP